MRCFVALEIPAGVRAAIARTQAAVRAAAADADVRWVRSDAIHLTLKFLGAVPDAQVARVSDALGASVKGATPLPLSAGGLGTFPGGSRPRVVWVGVTSDGDALRELAGTVDRALVGLGFPPEARPFRGHLTIGRVRSPRGGRGLARAIETPDAAGLGSWTAGEVVLYESRLRPTGAEYRVVSRHPLGSRDT